jgi:hypothetical protein
VAEAPREALWLWLGVALGEAPGERVGVWVAVCVGARLGGEGVKEGGGGGGALALALAPALRAAGRVGVGEGEGVRAPEAVVLPEGEAPGDSVGVGVGLLVPLKLGVRCELLVPGALAPPSVRSRGELAPVTPAVDTRMVVLMVCANMNGGTSLRVKTAPL